MDHKGSGESGRHVEHMFWVASCLVKLKSEAVDDRTTVLGCRSLGARLYPAPERGGSSYEEGLLA